MSILGYLSLKLYIGKRPLPLETTAMPTPIDDKTLNGIIKESSYVKRRMEKDLDSSVGPGVSGRYYD